MKKDDNMLSTKQLSKRLKISEPTIRKMAKNGELPVLRAGIHFRFYWPAIEKTLGEKAIQ